MSDSSVSIHIKNLVTVLVAGFAAVALFVWVHQESEGWVSLWSRRFAMGTTFIAALYLLADLLQIYMQIRRRRRAEAEARIRAAEEERAARRSLREGTREFMLFLEDQYSWVLEMPDLDQERKALLWYDEITTRWAEENERFHKLRANDDCAAADHELGLDLVERMFAIWDRRTQLYQYAIAWSDAAERAREILRIGRLIRQIQVDETREQQRFAEQVQTQLSSQSEPNDDGSDEKGIPWGPRPVQSNNMTGDVLGDFESDDATKEAEA